MRLDPIDNELTELADFVPSRRVGCGHLGVDPHDLRP